MKEIIFTSSSAIYGELKKHFNEETGPLFPISFYGAAKLSSEAFISAFCENYNFKGWILRLPNVVGERATHGVVFDFIKKLKKSPQKLFILGDGKQSKPYMYVKDVIDAIIFIWKNTSDRINYFNIGVDDLISVEKIARIIVKEMGLRNVEFEYTGENKGWKGDVPEYKYDLSKITQLGWKPKRTSEEAVRIAVRVILKEIEK